MSEKLDLEKVFKQFADTRKHASVDSVFGKAVASNGKTVIPIASAAYGFGLGGGVAEDESDSNVGGGGGGGYSVKPMAMAVIDDDGVRIEPILNEGRIALVSILARTWTIFWLGRVLLRLASRKTGKVKT